MINIIQQGMIRPYRLTCQICNCIFEFSDEDITDTEGTKSILCPTCENVFITENLETWLKPNLIEL